MNTDPHTFCLWHTSSSPNCCGSRISIHSSCRCGFLRTGNVTLCDRTRNHHVTNDCALHSIEPVSISPAANSSVFALSLFAFSSLRYFNSDNALSTSSAFICGVKRISSSTSPPYILGKYSLSMCSSKIDGSHAYGTGPSSI